MRKTAMLLTVISIAMPTFAADGSPIAPVRPPDGGTQVMFVVTAAAQFHCAQHRWPVSMAELLEFRNANKLLAHIKAAETWLLGPDVALVTEPNFEVRAHDVAEGKPIIVIAKQLPPLCKGKSITLQGASVHIDSDESKYAVPGA